MRSRCRIILTSIKYKQPSTSWIWQVMYCSLSRNKWITITFLYLCSSISMETVESCDMLCAKSSVRLDEVDGFRYASNFWSLLSVLTIWWAYNLLESENKKEECLPIDYWNHFCIPLFICGRLHVWASKKTQIKASLIL